MSPGESITRTEAREILDSPGRSVHLMGVCGVGMAGLAYLLHHRGHRVDGCDCRPNELAAWLRESGVAVRAGHADEHVAGPIDLLVRSTAVPAAHPEVAAARDRGIPVLSRGVGLAALLPGRCGIAVTGTHGKTTTTALIVHILVCAGADPSFFVGADGGSVEHVAGVGGGPHFVVEADESDGTAAVYCPDYGVLTNVEYDHSEHYADAESLHDCFRAFAGNCRERLVYCRDDPGAAKLGAPAGLGYGFDGGADCRGTDLVELPGALRMKVAWQGGPPVAVEAGIAGRHNALNVLAACAVAWSLGVATADIRAAVASFRPVNRRFQSLVDSRGILVVSDYAHHPTEVRAALSTAAGLGRQRIVAVFQPHRYSRTRALAADFPAALAAADHLILVPVYAASEAPVAGGTTADLYRHCVDTGLRDVVLADSLEAAWQRVKGILSAGDILLIVGAGDVDKMGAWAKEHLAQMEEADDPRRAGR